MKKILLCFLLFVTSKTFAQSEDCATKLSYCNNTLIILNKSCCTRYLIKRNGFSDSITCIVDKDSSLSLCIIFCGDVTVEPLIKCDSCAGIVKYFNNCKPLSVRLRDVSVQNYEDYIIVKFTVDELINVKSFEIYTTYDGAHFERREIILPKNVIVGKPYSSKIMKQ